MTTASQATTNIYEQQYQMGLFLRQHYPEATVAANDIGAINYLADVRCLDLYGLATSEVANHKRDGRYGKGMIHDLAKSKGAIIALVYDLYFHSGRITVGGVPPQWIKVGQWKIPNNVTCGDDTVSFYALDPSEEDSLIANLGHFASQLPENVRQSGKYIDQ